MSRFILSSSSSTAALSVRLPPLEAFPGGGGGVRVALPVPSLALPSRDDELDVVPDDDEDVDLEE